MPRDLVHDDMRARAITPDDLHDDVAGINASLEVIRRTRGGSWPTGPVGQDYDYADLVWHEVEFRDASLFTYTLRDAHDRYLGCLYLYPMGGRTALTDKLLAYDVDVSWWVTAAAYDAGWYPKAYAAIQAWLAEGLPFATPYFSNAEIPLTVGGRSLAPAVPDLRTLPNENSSSPPRSHPRQIRDSQERRIPRQHPPSRTTSISSRHASSMVEAHAIGVYRPTDRWLRRMRVRPDLSVIVEARADCGQRVMAAHE